MKLWQGYPHILSADQFDLEVLQTIFALAREMRNVVIERKNVDWLENEGRAVIFFYEPSTRTRGRFTFAIHYLGGIVVFETENATEYSSVAKGESTEDSIRTLNCYYPDVLVVRHIKEGELQKASAISRAPIINAGDGGNEHPTQAILDGCTVLAEVPNPFNKIWVFGGDLERSRTTRSLIKQSCAFQPQEIILVGDELVQITPDIEAFLQEQKVKYTKVPSKELERVLPEGDIFYWCRVQTERYKKDPEKLAAATENKVAVTMTQRRIEMMHANARFLHPYPRIDEFVMPVAAIDKEPRVATHEEMEWGLFSSMAELLMILNAEKAEELLLQSDYSYK